jgi:hypothetical protein
MRALFHQYSLFKWAEKGFQLQALSFLLGKNTFRKVTIDHVMAVSGVNRRSEDSSRGTVRLRRNKVLKITMHT